MKTSKPCIASTPKGKRWFPRAGVLFLAGGVVLLTSDAWPAHARGAAKESTRGAAGIHVAIDILPGEASNVFDPAATGPVGVAILGTPAFDPSSVDPGSLRLAGASAVKNALGATHAFEDVSGDGRADLVVWFSARALQVAGTDLFAVLEGTTWSGERIQGRDAIQTLTAALRSDARARDASADTAATRSEEKLPPLRPAIVALTEDPSHGREAGAGAGLRVAMLAGQDFDPADVVLETIRLNGWPIAKMATGELASHEDVDGDGLVDLVVTVPTKALDSGRANVDLRAMTRTGRIVAGETTVVPNTGLAEEGGAGPIPVEPAAVEPEPALPAAAAPAPVVPATAAKADRPPLELTADDAPAPPPRTIGAATPGVSIQGRFTGGITILDNSPAVQYPATIHMSGLGGAVSKLRVTLNGIVHSCFLDLDIMLVGPSGQSIVLMSDVGACGPANATDITFDDFATGTLAPTTLPPTSGSWRPLNVFTGDPFAAPAPVPSLAPALSAFIGTNPNGDWKLYVVDDAQGDTGSIRDGWTLDIETMTQVCNAGSFAVPAGAPGTTSGPASLYPSPITVSGLPPQIAKLSVTLDGLTHQNPDDLDVMLVAPGGQRIMLMSDSGGAVGVSNYQLTFDDDAAGYLPDDTVIVSPGTYRPTERTFGDVMPAPAPGGLYYTALTPLRGTDPNGAWQLYVADDTSGGVGSVARGWCLNITTIAPAENCQPFTFTVPAGAPATTTGPADIYPNTVYVTGTSGLIQSLRVKLMGLTHTFPDDLDMVLRAPSGRTLALMSDVGGTADVSNLDVTFDTAAAASAPDNGPLGPGPYKPTDFEPGETLPAPAPAGPYGSSLLGEVPNGDWSFWVADDAALDWGTIGGWCMSFTLYEPYTSYCSGASGSLTIPSGAPGTTSGFAFPYPWFVQVGQQGTIVRKVQVRVDGLTHTFPDDLDVLLVSPTGQKVLLMSDAGGGSDISQNTITFDDEAEFALPNSTLLNTGTYRPSNYDGADPDTFPGTAPPGPYATQLSAFNGIDPKGIWNLFVMDDANGDVGSAAQWCIDIYPMYPVGEATNLRWQGSSKTTLTWDAAPNATGYKVLRGSPSFFPSLLTSDTDSCVAVSPTGQIATGLAQLPGTGSIFWYLVTGTNGGPPGPSGRARVGGSETARIADAPGTCNAP